MKTSSGKDFPRPITRPTIFYTEGGRLEHFVADYTFFPCVEANDEFLQIINFDDDATGDGLCVVSGDTAELRKWREWVKPNGQRKY